MIQEATIKQSTGRIHSMDAVRAIAMLLGIVLHASISYKLTPSPPWPADDSVHSIFYNYLYLFIHSFRMQLFFLVAGFFARFLYLKIGKKAFVRHRIDRIVKPFIICLIVIAPLSMLPFFYYQYALLHPGLPFFQSLIPVMHFMLKWNGMIHLWFLYFLIIFYIVMLVMLWVNQYISISRLINRLCKKILVFPKASTLFFLFFPIFLMTCLFHRLPIEPYTGFKPDLPLLIYYSFFFYLGYFIHRLYVNNLSAITRFPIMYLLIGLAVTPLIGHWDLLQATDKSLRLFLGIRILFSIQTVTLVFGFLGIFIKYLNTENYTIRYISDASYWMYLVHVPLIVWAQIWLVDSVVPPFLRFWLVNIVGIFIPLITYALFVRHTFIGKTLNGPRRRRNKNKKVSSPIHQQLMKA
jgi:glucan biosynthesis protein C